MKWFAAALTMGEILASWFEPEVAMDLADRLLGHSERQAKVLEVDAELIHRALVRETEARLNGWMSRPGGPPEPDVERVARQVIDFEVHKLVQYRNSGVFPKRYFGWFDGQGDTGALEKDMAFTTRCVVSALNHQAHTEGNPLRMNEAEVAVTFIAEGGSLLIELPEHKRNALHPVFDVGLDDIARGIADEPARIALLAKNCGLELSSLVAYTAEGAPAPAGAEAALFAPKGKAAWLMRGMTFDEAIAGTALMWWWEMQIADRKLAEKGERRLHQLPRDERFIASSLVYNSGLIHSAETRRKIRSGSTADMLFARSEDNAHRRPRLNLLGTVALTREVLASGYREQPTSWVAVYHVLQRYGAYAALRDFADSFDAQGRLTLLPPPPSARNFAEDGTR